MLVRAISLIDGEGLSQATFRIGPKLIVRFRLLV
jgi:hypothetical protein